MTRGLYTVYYKSRDSQVVPFTFHVSSRTYRNEEFKWGKRSTSPVFGSQSKLGGTKEGTRWRFEVTETEVDKGLTGKLVKQGDNDGRTHFDGSNVITVVEDDEEGNEWPG